MKYILSYMPQLESREPYVIVGDGKVVSTHEKLELALEKLYNLTGKQVVLGEVEA